MRRRGSGTNGGRHGGPVVPAYRLTHARRVLNGLMRAMIALGVGPGDLYLLTVRGRRTGKPRSTPVTVLEDERGRWLVAAYGPVDWVRNARVAGRVTLTRRGRARAVPVTEVDGAEAAPVLQRYVRHVRVARPYFTARAGDPVEAFAAEASRHPVFRVGEDLGKGDAP